MAKAKVPHFYKVTQGCEGYEVGKILVLKKSCGPVLNEIVIDKSNNVLVVQALKVPIEDIPAQAIQNAIDQLWPAKG